jgi:poly-gamma-glutamate synthesis protein (capsule biosynthesis protein)
MRRFLFFAAFLVAGSLLSAVGPDTGPEVRLRPPPVTTLVGVGDILLGRSLGTIMESTHDYSMPFRNMEAQLGAADIAFGNLEGPFCAEPAAIAGLVHAGFAVLNVANNHFDNGGYACMRFSLEHVHQAGIATVGAGETYAAAHQPAILVRHGVRFAFLGYTYADLNDAPDSSHPVIAGRNPAHVREDVAAALRQADAVIVSLHDGAEYTPRVAPETEEFCHAAIDAGAAVVLGHHPHVPQRVEQYHDGWIFYSIGNFVFQQYKPPETRTALMARVTFLGARVVRVEAVPLVIEYHSRPRPASVTEGAPILARIGLDRPLLWPPVEASLQPAWVAPASAAPRRAPSSNVTQVSASPQTVQ